jgi:phosphoribosyl 1,2-cyclic phosphate phosphodiesterase
MQLVREKIRCLDYVFITHWHYDHFGGLGDLEFYVKLSRETPLKLFLPPEALGEFHSTYPFLHDVFDPVPWQFDQVYSFHNLMLTPLPAVHSVQTAGIFLKSEKTGKTMAYFTDTSGLSASTLQKIKNTDIFICDATFHGDNWYPHSHLSIEEAINLGQDVKAQKTILTHLAMHYSTPITVARLEQKIKNHSKVCLAFDGMELQL